MPYIVIEDFRAGYDKRRPAIAAAPGSLQKIVNAHITRGGDIEKRKAFVSTYTLPAGTFGFAELSENLYVFGSAADPGVPVGVNYQRLQHPDGLAMTGIRGWSLFQGKLYVVAEFSNGDVLHFYDGVVVGDWINGVVRSSFTNNDGIASELADLINASEADVTAIAAGSVVTVTSNTNNQFEFDTFVENVSGGTDDQTLVASTVQEAVLDLEETRATCSFQVVAGERDPGVCEVQNIRVNGVSIIGTSDIDWTGTNEYTAQLIADAINAHTSNPNYEADAEGNTVIITASEETGAEPNGYELEVTVGEKFIVNIGSFEITGGSTGSYTNLAIDGSNIATTDVAWATSNTATASAIATQIRADSTTYTAVAIGQVVYVGRLTSTSGTPNNLTLRVTQSGDLAIGGTAGTYESQINTTLTPMSGGTEAVSGQPQITTFTVGGTFEVGDKFTVTIGEYDIGATSVSGEKVEAVLTHQQKVYALFGSVLGFSGVAEPTLWGSTVTGAGQIDMSTQAEGSELLTALTVYQSELAVFARRTIQREFVDVDPSQNTLLQTINNFGTIAPDSVVSFGESDVFFLADNGVRSLRARDSSNTAAISDIGTPIDTVIIDLLNSLTDEQIGNAQGIIEPEDGRYLLSINNRVFVFSFFPVSKISAWSEYDLGFTVDQWAVAGSRLYARSGDTIYLYGGADNATYDASKVEITTPFIDGRKGAEFKNWTAYDVALQGEWTLFYALDPNEDPTDANNHIEIGTVSKTSYHLARHGLSENSPYLSLSFTHEKAEPAILTNVALHYNGTRVE